MIKAGGLGVSVHSSGVVLLPLSRWHDRAIVLDSTYGKRMVITRNHRALAGSLLSYQVSIGRVRQESLFLSQVTCMAAPFGADQSALGYIHLLLEVVHKYLPMGAHAPELFVWLKQILGESCSSVSSMDARLVLALQLCSLCGFYPELQVYRHRDIHQLISMPLADVKSIVLNKTIKTCLLRWVQNCIAVQMGLCNLKTFGYLSMERS